MMIMAMYFNDGYDDLNANINSVYNVLELCKVLLQY